MERCIVRAASSGIAPFAAGGAAALRTLLFQLYAGRLFEIPAEQEHAAGICQWLHDADAAPETLDVLRLLGLRVVRDVVAGEIPHRPDMLHDADVASGERVMRTLTVQGLHERLPPELLTDIARCASAGAPSWRLGLRPMTAPRTDPIVAADARTAQRRARAAQALTAGTPPP